VTTDAVVHFAWVVVLSVSHRRLEELYPAEIRRVITM